MKLIIGMLLAILQLVASRPQQINDTRIIAWENINDGEGNFKIAFQTTNGITQQQVGELKLINSTTNATVMKGHFSVIAPNSSMHKVLYISDEHGFQYRSSIIAPSLGLSNTTLSHKEERNPVGTAIESVEEPKTNKTSFLHQAVFTPLMLHLSNTTDNSTTNQTASKEFPDRIGTPAIITLMGPPG